MRRFSRYVYCLQEMSKKSLFQSYLCCLFLWNADALQDMSKNDFTKKKFCNYSQNNSFFFEILMVCKIWAKKLFKKKISKVRNVVLHEMWMVYEICAKKMFRVFSELRHFPRNVDCLQDMSKKKVFSKIITKKSFSSKCWCFTRYEQRSA